MISTPYAARKLLNLKKCHWFTFKVEYLAHIITLRMLNITEAHTKYINKMKHTLTPTKLRSFLEKECLAFVWAFQSMRPYLQSGHFIVHTDQQLIRWLLGITEPSGRLMRGRLPLGEFTFDIVYKKGNFNTQADALSRLNYLGHTTVPLNEKMPTSPDATILDTEQAALMSDSDVLDHILLTQ